ncbi:CHAT domain-containing tetratricopeptide repeat protein [Aetokthonos hydrillicola]|nr:CHAT domain-containing protein [Aetokthonos hydrillicola]
MATAVSTGFAFNLLTPFLREQVLDQSPEASNSELERLWNSCKENFQKNRFQAVLQSCQQAAITAERIGDRSVQAKSLTNLGYAYHNRGNAKQALTYYQQALVIFRAIKKRDLEAQIVTNLGAAYRDLGNYAKAIEYHQQALTIARQIKDSQRELWALGNLGNAYNDQSKYKEAIDYYQQVLAIARQIKDRQSEFQVLGNLGIAYNSLGDYTKASEYYQQSLTIAREFKNPLGEAQALGGLGNVYHAWGKYNEAIKYHEQQLTIARQINNPPSQGQALGGLGNAYNSLGEYQKAVEYYRQQLTIARQINSPRSEAKALVGLGLASLGLGNYDNAVEYNQQSLVIARQIKDLQSEGQALGNLGLAYNSLGEYAKAIESNQQSLAIARQIKDLQSESRALGNLGLTFLFLGNYTETIKHYEQSLAITQKIKDPNFEGKVLGNLGLAYLSLGNYAIAIDYEQQALAIAQKIKDPNFEGRVLGNLGIVYRNQGDYTRAIEYTQQWLIIAQRIKDPQGESAALGNLGNTYINLGDYTKGIEYHQQSLRIARQIKDPQTEGLALNNLGVALQKSGKISEAEKILFQGIGVWESQRQRLGSNDSFKISIFEEQARTYRILQQVLIAQNKIGTSLEIAERGRARAFVDLLQRRLQSNPKTEHINSRPTIELLKQTAKQQNATLVQYSIIVDDFQTENKLQSKESELYIWVIKPTGEIKFQPVDLKPLWQKQKTSLEQIITETLKSLGSNFNSRSSSSSDRENFEVGDFVKPNETLNEFPSDPPWKVVAVDIQNRTVRIQSSNHQQEQNRKFTDVTKVSYTYAANTYLQQLNKILIEPIADSLPKNERDRVIFIPQGSLFFVPFPALQDANRNYLIQKHTIQTAPSIQVLDLTRQQRQKLSIAPQNKPKEVLVVGNPTMPKVSPFPGKTAEQLKPLPHSEEEAKQVAQMFKTNAIAGDRATKSAILPLFPKARIIHLATHALLDDITGGTIPGAIALAPEPLNKGEDERTNGLLRSSEIFNLQLNNTELVVLSACDTGRGKITGDGVIGLSRSFISAGVPSVIVSLWSIPDDSTALLMTEFYKLQQGNDKASALRQAMLTTMEKNPDPQHWAAFTLIGEAK